MSTIRDVAQRAGVSIATVSNYINGTRPVSADSSRRIRSAIDELHYTVNHAARSLRQNSAGEIGVILPNLDDPYYIQIYKGIRNAFSSGSYFVDLAFSDDQPELEQKSVASLLSRQICGLILITCQPDAWKYYYDRFTAQGKPIVLIDRQIRFLDAGCVQSDHAHDIRAMTEALLQSGKRQLCLFTGPRAFSCEEDCIRGFQEALAENGVMPSCARTVETALSKEQAFSKAIRILKRFQPDAILCTCELCAEGITEALRLLGFSRVPVFSLGEARWNCYTQSVASFCAARPAIRIGDTAGSMLLEQLTSSLRDTEQITLGSQLSVRSIRFSDAPEPEVKPENPRLRILMLDNPVIHTFAGLLRNFEQSDHIQTEITFLPHHQILGEIQTASRQYDVMMYDLPWLPALASGGILSDVTEDLGLFDRDAFIPGFSEHIGRFRDRYYGIPFMYAPQMLYYRKDLFDDPLLSSQYERKYGVCLRPPLTMKEYTAMAEFFTKQTRAVDYGLSVAAAYNECFAPEIYFRLQSFGSELFDENGVSRFDNPQTLKAYLNLLRSVRFAKPDYLQATDTSIVRDFLRGETAMLITYPAFFSEVTDLQSRSASIGCSFVPGRTPLLGGWGLGVSENCSNRAGALRFMRWACDQTISNYFTVMGGQTAISESYENDEMTKLYPWLPLYYSAHRDARLPFPNTVRGGIPIAAEQIDAVLCKGAYALIAGEADLQTVISGTDRALQAVLLQQAEAFR